MPEGHSILRAANHWNRIAEQPLVLSSPQGRFAAEAAQLTGRELQKAYAHGKHLFLQFSPDEIVHIHLGLYGRHRWHSKPLPDPRDTVRLRAEYEKGAVDLSGPTRCELLEAPGVQKILDRLGPDPLKFDEAPEDFLDRMGKLKLEVGRVLMDQSRIAGVGNVYRAEILFMAGISPFAEARSIPREDWKKLWRLTRELMLHGVAHAGGIETIYRSSPRPEMVPEEVKAACASRTYVYKRTGLPCLACGNPVVEQEYFGRSLYYCPVDQPLNSELNL